jgi:hypothetical protein
MNRKTLYTIFFIILLLIVLVLNCSVIDEITGLKQPAAEVSTFQELVLDDYLEKSTGDEFRYINLFLNYVDDYEGRNCNDKELMRIVIDRLCKIELMEYKYKLDSIPDEYYSLNIRGEKAGEKIEINFFGNHLSVFISVLDITEDKQRKIIHYDTAIEHKLFKITGNNLEDGYLDELFSLLEEQK